MHRRPCGLEHAGAAGLSNRVKPDEAVHVDVIALSCPSTVPASGAEGRMFPGG